MVTPAKVIGTGVLNKEVVVASGVKLPKGTRLEVFAWKKLEDDGNCAVRVAERPETSGPGWGFQVRRADVDRTWYGCFHCFSRGGEKTVLVEYDFEPDTDPRVVMEVLKDAAYHGMSAHAALEDFLFVNPAPGAPDFSFGRKGDGLRELVRNESYAANSEEWNGAIACRKEDLLEAYVRSEPNTM